MTYRLVSSRISPDVELVRWVLARQGLAFREDAHIPGLQRPVPRILTPDGETWRGAREILGGIEGATPGLYADAAERTLALALVEGLSGHVPRLVYPAILGRPRALLPAATHRTPKWERWFAAGLYPVWRLMAARDLGASAAQAAEAAAQVETALSTVEAVLSERGADFLGGAAPGTADVVLAALAGPIVLPPSYGARLPAREDLSAETRALIAATRARPAGRLVLRTYEAARHPAG